VDGVAPFLNFQVFRAAVLLRLIQERKNRGIYVGDQNKARDGVRGDLRCFQWLTDSIPQKGEAISLKKYSMWDMARDADISAADCEYICKELRRRILTLL
jgi:hypothetical protein